MTKKKIGILSSAILLFFTFSLESLEDYTKFTVFIFLPNPP